MKNVIDVLFDNPNIDPARTALSWEGGSISYAEFQAAIRRAASALQKQGIKQGDRVSILMENQPEYLIAYFAITAIGGVYVPLNWQLLPEEHITMMQSCEVRFLFAGSKFKATYDAALVKLPDLLGITVVGEDAGEYTEFGDWCADTSADLVFAKVDPDELALIVFTSGTTSSPKGACLTHKNVLTDIRNVAECVGARQTDVALHLTPLYHQSFVHAAVHLFVGAQVHIANKFSADMVLHEVPARGVTYMFAVPTMLYEIIDNPDSRKSDLTSLRTISYGAAPIIGARLAEALDLFGPVMIHAYGLTETTSHCSVLMHKEHLEKEGSVGKALPGTSVRIIQPDGRDCSVNQIGEVVIQGPTVMRDYWRNPKATNETIVDGWLRTGDLGRFDEDGYLYIVDRKKDLVVSGGVNIYPSDIEEVLAKHPNVKDVAVFGLPDEYWGEALTAAIVPYTENPDLAEDIAVYARENLSGYKKPKHIKVIKEMPRNPSGKILKRELRELFSK